MPCTDRRKRLLRVPYTHDDDDDDDDDSVSGTIDYRRSCTPTTYHNYTLTITHTQQRRHTRATYLGNDRRRRSGFVDGRPREVGGGRVATTADLRGEVVGEGRKRRVEGGDGWRVVWVGRMRGGGVGLGARERRKKGGVGRGDG